MPVVGSEWDVDEISLALVRLVDAICRYGAFIRGAAGTAGVGLVVLTGGASFGLRQLNGGFVLGFVVGQDAMLSG